VILILINISQTFRTQVAQNYLDMLLIHTIFPVITKSTRISNLFSITIDHVITNCDTHHLIPGIIQSDLTDHYPTFCIIQDTLKHKQPKKYSYRSMKNFNLEHFVTDLNYRLNNSFIPDLNIKNLNSIFDQFLALISSTIEIHAPLKIASKKQQKLLSKPWLT